MYLDQYTMVTFEYHCYQNESQYSILQAVDKTNSAGANVLRTHEFDSNDTPHPMSIFEKTGITNYRETSSDFLKQEKVKANSDFMRIYDDALPQDSKAAESQNNPYYSNQSGTQQKDALAEEQLVEGIICLYKVTPEGNLMK